MYLLVLSNILIITIFNTLFGKFIGKNGSIILTLIGFLISWAASLLIFFEVAFNNYICTIKLCNWISIQNLVVDWGLLYDMVTVTMLIVILTISFLVHIYTISYMSSDPYFIRFYIYLNLFTFFMLLLITADNFLQMFFGWEGVGIVSYLLINFWYTRFEANKSAIKAILINRIGDIGIYLSLIFIFVSFKSLSYYTVFNLSYWFSTESMNLTASITYDIDISKNWLFFIEKLGEVKINNITLIMIFILIGAMSKSAQIGLHTWLPDAMEGPTPVSALLHAATMVTAGVFILIRCSPIIEYSPDLLFVITFIGAITAFFTATIGLVQNDLKKVIAYSTCSQLGYMVFAIGLSGYSVALFHLFNHAFFKALLFLGAGAVIHSLNDEQDMRKMGGLVLYLPIVYTGMLIGSLTLAGVPFLSGYYSKDIILEFAASTYKLNGLFSFWLGTVGSFFTAFYSFRLLYLTFLRKYNGSFIFLKNTKESIDYTLLPIIILSLSSIFVGYFASDLFIGLGNDTWSNSLLVSKYNNIFLISEYLPCFIKLIPTFACLFGLFFSFFFYLSFNYIFSRLNIILLNKSFFNFFLCKWYFDHIYNNYIAKFGNFLIYNVFSKTIDRGFIEYFGPIGVIRVINRIVHNLRIINSGSLHNYIFFIILSIHFILIISCDFFNNYSFLSNYLFVDLDFFIIFFFLILFFYSLPDNFRPYASVR